MTVIGLAMPSADLFDGEWISCDRAGNDDDWYAYPFEPKIGETTNRWVTNNANYSLRGVKMPDLTGDEWKLSKISIADLREWQKANPSAD